MRCFITKWFPLIAAILLLIGLLGDMIGLKPIVSVVLVIPALIFMAIDNFKTK